MNYGVSAIIDLAGKGGPGFSQNLVQGSPIITNSEDRMILNEMDMSEEFKKNNESKLLLKKRKRTEDDFTKSEKRQKRYKKLVQEESQLLLQPRDILVLIAEYLTKESDQLAFTRTCNKFRLIGHTVFLPTEEQFITAIEEGDIAETKYLLEDGRINPSISNNYAIQHACLCGFKEIVFLLLGDKRVDATCFNNEPLKCAIGKGNYTIVQLLLNHGCGHYYELVEFEKKTRRMEQKVCRFGSTAEKDRIVKLFLKDEKVQKCVDYSFRKKLYFLHNNAHLPEDCIIVASINCDHHIVQLLLNDERVDPGHNENEAIIMASMFGHYKVVKLLLQDRRVNPADQKNEALIKASNNGHYKIVFLLLRDKRVHPAAQNNKVILTACKHCNIKAIKLLLKNKNVDPWCQGPSVISNALAHNNYKVVDILLNDYRADVSLKKMVLTIIDLKDSKNIRWGIDSQKQLFIKLVPEILMCKYFW